MKCNLFSMEHKSSDQWIVPRTGVFAEDQHLVSTLALWFHAACHLQDKQHRGAQMLPEAM